MKTTERTTIEPGTLIHGTLRSADLIPAFTAELIRLTFPDYIHSEPMTPEVYAKVSNLLNGLDQLDVSKYAESSLTDLFDTQLDEYQDMEVMTWIVEELFQEINENIPDESGLYFGSHPGNGSDFGFWETESEYTADDFKDESFYTLYETVHGEVYVMPKLASYGDYSNSSNVEMSNYQSIPEHYGLNVEELPSLSFRLLNSNPLTLGEPVYTVYGDFGSNALLIRLTHKNDEILESILSLESYPLFNDQHYSDMEYKLLSDMVESDPDDVLELLMNDSEEWNSDKVENLASVIGTDELNAIILSVALHSEYYFETPGSCLIFQRKPAENLAHFMELIESELYKVEKSMVDSFDELLNESDVEILGMTYETSRVLREVDPIAYREYLLQYLNDFELPEPIKSELAFKGI